MKGGVTDPMEEREMNDRTKQCQAVHRATKKTMVSAFSKGQKEVNTVDIRGDQGNGETSENGVLQVPSTPEEDRKYLALKLVPYR